jgi:hypothetical protein
VTEPQWLESSDVDLMLDFIRPQASDRKWRLFLCACGRRTLPVLKDKAQESFELCDKALEVCERFADGLASAEEMAGCMPSTALVFSEVGSPRLATEVAWRARYLDLAGNTRPMRYGKSIIGHPASEGAEFARGAISLAAADFPKPADKATIGKKRAATISEKRAQAALVRDLFGNPFRELPPQKGQAAWTKQYPQWRTWNDATIPKLAQAIYEQRRFQDLPVLADALEDAGCSGEGILRHCREGGEHVKGCWVVDLLLGKS